MKSEKIKKKCRLNEKVVGLEQLIAQTFSDLEAHVWILDV